MSDILPSVSAGDAESNAGHIFMPHGMARPAQLSTPSFSITGPKGLMVKVDLSSGDVTFGEAYDLDEAASAFWRDIGLRIPPNMRFPAMSAGEEELRKLSEAATQGEWGWMIPDASMAILCGPDEMRDVVLAVSPCKSCQGRHEEWKWGRCVTPSEADAKFIPALVNWFRARLNPEGSQT